MVDNKKIREAAIKKYGFFSAEFESGAIWAQQEFVKSLWHDASEEPKNSGYIITKYFDSEERAMYYELDNIHRNVRWEEYATLNCIIQWCYLSDILQKEGGER